MKLWQQFNVLLTKSINEVHMWVALCSATAALLANCVIIDDIWSNWIKMEEIYKIEEWLTSGNGFACPEQWMCPPVLLENSTLYGGSWTKIGPCKSNDATSISFYIFQY